MYEVQWATFPWALNCSNHLSDGDQLRPVLVPDIEPVEIVGDRGRLGMAAGDFVEVFENEEFKKHFDAVVTCFFLDTAHNPIAYMETIYKVLKVILTALIVFNAFFCHASYFCSLF